MVKDFFVLSEAYTISQRCWEQYKKELLKRLRSQSRGNSGQEPQRREKVKKELTKEDLAQYIETMPDSVFLRLPGAGKYLRKKAAETVRTEGCPLQNRTTFKEAMRGVMEWARMDQGHSFWSSLYDEMPYGLGIDIPDPSPVFPTLKAGQKVLLKTLDELAATPGAKSDGFRITFPDMESFVGTMFPVAGAIVTLHRYGASERLKAWIDDDTWNIDPWMVKAVVPDTPYISSADDPRVPSLIGKEVYYADSVEGIMSGACGKAVLNRARTGDETQWPFVVGPFDSIFAYIREIPEGKEEKTTEAAIEVTMAEVCAKFGKNVKIKKE